MDQLSLEDLESLKRDTRIELARRAAKRKDILEWGLALFPDKFPLEFCYDLHQYFVDIRGEEKTNTKAPRYHSKTTIKCFLIPIFQALEESGTFRHYLNVQATSEKANAVNLAIKLEMESNEELREIYGDQMGRDKWTDYQFVLRNGIAFTAVGAGKSIRGINYRNIRPDYIIVDDLYDEEDINNPESTLKKTSWFWLSLFPARSMSRRCAIHVQGTAINQDDLLTQLETKHRWKSRTFKAITSMDKREVLWPELNSFDSLMLDKADMGSVIFFREMQNEPRDEESSIIKAAWLKDWECNVEELVFDKHLSMAGVILGCDPSIGAKSENDATGVALIFKTQYTDAKSCDYYIVGLWNEHLSLDARVKLLQKIQDDLPTTRKITRANLEGIAGFKDFVAEVRRRTTLPVHEIDFVKDKITNLENKSHYFENGKVHIDRKVDPMLKDELVYQLTTNHPKRDDLRDSVLLCLDDKSASWRSWV